MNAVRVLAAVCVLVALPIASCKKQSQQTVPKSTPALSQSAGSQATKNVSEQPTPAPLAGVAKCESTTASVVEPPGKRILIGKFRELFITDPAGMREHKLTDDAALAALSSDGHLVAYADDKHVYVIRLADGHCAVLASLTGGHVKSLAWSPDQKSVAYDEQLPMKNGNLFLASYPPAGPPRDLGYWYETLSFSPDSKLIVHPTLDTTSGAKGSLETVDVETRKRETIYAGTDVIWDAQYAPDGSRIAFLMNRPEPAPASNDSDSDDGPDCSGPDRDLWVVAPGSKKAEKVMSSVFHFEWSPDGRFLAIETGAPDCGYPPGDGAVFISSRDGKVQFQLSKKAPSINPKFSPDSKQVAFLDFNARSFVVGDLTTRNLTALAGSNCEDGPCTIYDWK